MRVVYPGLLAALLVSLSMTSVAQEPELELPQFENDDDVELTPEQEYAQLLRQINGLIIYNSLRENQIQNQDREMRDIQVAMGRVPEIERQLPALLVTMVDALEEFIRLDAPFRPEERADRLADLQSLIQSDANAAEKFRRVFEAWQIENDYGRDYTTYQGQLDIDGATREVSFLQLGRVALIYQTPDLEHTGVWDANAGAWQPLGTRYRNSVRQVLRMARSQIAPQLVLVPVPPPEG